MLKYLLNLWHFRKLMKTPDEATYPHALQFIDSVVIAPPPEVVITDADADGWGLAAQYEQDAQRLNALIERRVEMQRRRRKATSYDAEITEIRHRMLAYENRRK